MGFVGLVVVKKWPGKSIFIRTSPKKSQSRKNGEGFEHDSLSLKGSRSEASATVLRYASKSARGIPVASTSRLVASRFDP